MDIIKELITGYYNKGKVILEPELVIYNYFSSGVIFIDLISLIPFIYINFI